MPPPAPTPPRLFHLLPLPVLAEQLSPSYAKAHNREAVEVYEEVKSGIDQGRLREPLCDALWHALKRERSSMSETELLEKVAAAMAKKGGPTAREAKESEIEGMSALFAFIDINVGRASETARAALETERGQAMLQKSLAVAATFLANRLLSVKTK